MISEETLRDALIERHGEEFYNKMHSAFVIIAGLGGLGSNIAVSLARAGIGALRLIDFDTVDISNINRQYYTLGDIGKNKTDALEEILRSINPYIRLEKYCTRVTEDNAAELLSGADIIAEAFDKAEQKAMLVNTALEQCPRATIVSGVGMAGYADANLIKTRRITKRLYVCDGGAAGVEDGEHLMAPRVAICAGHQANCIIRLIMEGNK